jgi:predicted nuclease of predicted toxin-antitoxin system
MRFLIDMKLSPSWVDFLREAGHEAIHWSAVGAFDASDRTLTQWAAEPDYVVLTNDLSAPSPTAISTSPATGSGSARPSKKAA